MWFARLVDMLLWFDYIIIGADLRPLLFYARYAHSKTVVIGSVPVRVSYVCRPFCKTSRGIAIAESLSDLS